MIPVVERELIAGRGWLTVETFTEVIAIAEMTPGPVAVNTATFVGYLLAGNAGAAAATLGIFLPAFVFVAASAPLVPRLRRSWIAGAVLDGVNVASLALMAVVVLQLVSASVVDVPTSLLALASLVILLRWKPNTTWLILGGAVAGWATRALR